MSVTDRPNVPPLDFTVQREDWNRYDLADNSILKVKIVLIKIRNNGEEYNIDYNHLFVVLTNERGEPDTRVHSFQELQNSITRRDIRFTTVSQDWNEYTIDDGTRVRIQPMVSSVSKTSLFDKHGDPIYVVEIQANMTVRRPDPSN